MNISRIAMLTALVAATFTVASPASANLIQNGSMELPNASNVIPTNWSLITNSFGTYNGFAAHDGQWMMHAGNSYGAGGEYQDVATTIGTTYELEFWAVGFTPGAANQQGIVQVGTPGIDDNSLTLNNNGEYVDTTFDVPIFTNVNDWTQFTHSFTANSTTTRISFQNVFLGSNQSAVNIDSVSLTAQVTAPEPSSLILCTFGLVGLVTRRRRRRRS